MNQVIENLFISDARTTENMENLRNADIKRIIALGCDENYLKHEGIEYLINSNILDTPETVIAHLFEETNLFISSSLKKKEPLLVHCIHGQSRSATVIVIYLMTIGYSADQAIETLKTARPQISINPGFLAQIYFTSFHDLSCPEALLLKGSAEDRIVNSASPPPAHSLDRKGVSGGKRKRDGNGAVTISARFQSVCCQRCSTTLCSNDQVVSHSTDPQAFVAAHVDDFWRQYHVYHSKSLSVLTLPLEGSVATLPQEWMLAQLRQHFSRQSDAEMRAGTSVELRCPSCVSVCGLWRRRCVNLFGPYHLVDLFALHHSAVTSKLQIMRQRGVETPERGLAGIKRKPG